MVQITILQKVGGESNKLPHAMFSVRVGQRVQGIASKHSSSWHLSLNLYGCGAIESCASDFVSAFDSICPQAQNYPAVLKLPSTEGICNLLFAWSC